MTEELAAMRQCSSSTTTLKSRCRPLAESTSRSHAEWTVVGRLEMAWKRSAWLESCDPDFGPLDVQMPMLDGFRYSASIDLSIEVIFTAQPCDWNTRFALSEVHAVDYLLPSHCLAKALR